ncbi:DUF1453 family protein [Streptomyces sp. NBC_01335]|uniref:DUF1453 domain-containing protein n=1 Tax=Streptomyces sp. NBC_01335 TaxID=2903828 RepID=UPI002E0E40FD|nr:DUF1453 family protein [Streptomyces sp. NBC_01335]
MSGVVSALVIVAVAGWTLLRQFSARPLSARWWLLPAILAVLALRGGSLLDARHETLSAEVLTAELVLGLVLGAGWGWATRIWREPDGTPWSKGTRATAFVWAGGLVLRAALWAVGAAAGLEQSTDGLLLALAVTLLARGGVLAWRLEGLPLHAGPAGGPGDRSPAAIGPVDGIRTPTAGKDLP